MLPAPCKWIDTEAGSYLNWHHGCIAYVALRDGKPLVLDISQVAILDREQTRVEFVVGMRDRGPYATEARLG